MKKAFMITIHQLPEQANLLINQLITDKDADVFVHIDKKSSEDLKCKIIKNDQVFFVKNNISISWGSSSLLKAVLNSYKEIINTKKDYEYVIMVTGQDLLIKHGLNEFLEDNKGKAYIDCDNRNPQKSDRFKKAMLLHPWPNIFLKRYDFILNPIKIARALRIQMFIHFPSLHKKMVGFDISNIQFYYDKVWHAFPIEIVKFISEFLTKNPMYWNIYENSLMADEGFFTTLIMNSAQAASP